MKTRYILFAFAALAMSACARNVEPAEPECLQVTVTASLEGNDPTRTTVQDGGTQVYWETAEEIKVFFRNSIGRFISQNTEQARTADFTGAFSAVVGSNEGEATSHLIWGLYPFRADATYDGSSVTTTLPSAQTGRAGSFAKNTNITIAQSVGLNLAFYNVCGGLRFSLTQEGIKRITFEGNNGEALAGKIKIAFEDGGVPVVSEVVAKDSVLTLTAPNGGSFQTGVWYYLSAIPGTLSVGYKMVFYKESESASRTSTNPVTIKRGIFGSLAYADDGLVFTPTGSGDEPDPDDVIQFADPIAKYACVDKFDTSGDGEVSYAEAAAATSLSGLFTDWNTVTSFDEIQYFTGVTSTVGVFDNLPKLKCITIPDHITTLGSFQSCTDLQTVVLPSTLSTLPYCCFNLCSSLTDVTLPEGITSIPENGFYGCSSLISLDLPASITEIGRFAFYDCSNLSDLNLPEGFTSIGESAFGNCQSLILEFPSSLTSIGFAAFYNCSSLQSITIANGASIGEYAFSHCSSLASVILPDDLTALPDYSFEYCDSLANITWPDELKTIGTRAFEGCRFKNNNYTLQLPSSITTIGYYAFGYLRHLILPSTSAVSIQSNSFKSDYTYFYVPANMVEMYKVRTNWSNYTDRIRSIGDYPASFTVGGTIGEAVDLGLSVKWASWNVGASAPEEYGAYFAWGETETTPWDCSWAEYKWCNGASHTKLTKYCPSYKTDYWDGIGTPDNKTTLNSDDDVAHANWGGTWRMPTNEEWGELINNCTSVWATENGVFGMRFTCKKEGYTDKSIFLPAAGYRFGSELYDAGQLFYYWSSSLNKDYPSRAMYLGVISGGVRRLSVDRCIGHSIRPVCE